MRSVARWGRRTPRRRARRPGKRGREFFAWRLTPWWAGGLPTASVPLDTEHPEIWKTVQDTREEVKRACGCLHESAVSQLSQGCSCHGKFQEEERAERESHQSGGRGSARDARGGRQGADQPKGSSLHCQSLHCQLCCREPGCDQPQGPTPARARQGAAAGGDAEPLVAHAGAGGQARLPDLPGPRRPARPARGGRGAGGARAQARHPVASAPAKTAAPGRSSLRAMATSPEEKGFGQADPRLTRWAEQVYRPEDEVLREIRERSIREGLPPIAVGRFDGLHLEVLTRAAGARTAVEIGTLGGYSGVCLLRGMGPEGVLHTFELEPTNARVAAESFEKAGVARQARIHVGPALEKLREIEGEGPFDFCFIDPARA